MGLDYEQVPEPLKGELARYRREIKQDAHKVPGLLAEVSRLQAENSLLRQRVERLRGMIPIENRAKPGQIG